MGKASFLHLFRFVMLAVIVSWGLFPFMAAHAEEWKDFSSKEGGFTIKFPAATISGRAGKGDSAFKTEAIKRTAVDGLGYTLYWKLREKPFGTAPEVDGYLKGQQKGVAASGKLVNEAEITFDGNKGREFTVTIDATTCMRCRVLVIDKLVCMLVIQGRDPEAVKSAEAERFFKSFKVDREKSK